MRRHFRRRQHRILSGGNIGIAAIVIIVAGIDNDIGIVVNLDRFYILGFGNLADDAKTVCCEEKRADHADQNGQRDELGAFVQRGKTLAGGAFYQQKAQRCTDQCRYDGEPGYSGYPGIRLPSFA